MEITKEEYAALIIANEKLQLLMSIIENSVMGDYQGGPWLNGSAMTEAMRMAGIDVIDKAFEKFGKENNNE